MSTPPPWLLQCLPLDVRLASASAPHEPRAVSGRKVERPHITLTWAQSLDFKIAGPGGARVILSGPESMKMTHWLRAMHNSILVGINTIVLDDPRLQAILPPGAPPVLNPQPLILDPSLRFPLKARMLSEWNKNKDVPGHKVCQPWIVCGDKVPAERREEVERAGARVIPTQLDKTDRIPPSGLPDILRDLGLGSVMIEGGSHILSSFLHAPPRSDGSPLADSVIITVAPMFIGEGVGVVPEGQDKGLPALRTVHTETMGKDAVMVRYDWGSMNA